MHQFNIPDMSCGHCVSAVSKAIRTADPDAVADIDLATHRATVRSKVDAAVILAALEDAGYPATL